MQPIPPGSSSHARPVRPVTNSMPAVLPFLPPPPFPPPFSSSSLPWKWFPVQSCCSALPAHRVSCSTHHDALVRHNPARAALREQGHLQGGSKARAGSKHHDRTTMSSDQCCSKPSHSYHHRPAPPRSALNTCNSPACRSAQAAARSSLDAAAVMNSCDGAAATCPSRWPPCSPAPLPASPAAAGLRQSPTCSGTVPCGAGKHTHSTTPVITQQISRSCECTLCGPHGCA